jgi:integrase
MSLFRKDNGTWYYTFYVGNRRYRKSTHTTSESKARKIESVAFAKAQELGPQAVIAKAPRLIDFGDKRFLPWVNETHGLNPKSRRYYKCGWELLKKTPVLNMPIDRITSEIVDRLALSCIYREKMSPSYRNQALRTLSRALHLAVEWKVINQAPRIHLEVENEREELITPDREQALLKHAGPILRDVIIVCQDTGARPEEIFRLRIEDIHWDERWIFNRCGKTKNSKRYLPISDRMLPLLQARAQSKKEGWVFPSKSKCGHLPTVSKMFARARELAGLPKTVVLYSARHTFGTTVLEETHNPAVTMKAMGHGSARMMMRYQHPEYVEAVRLAINRRNESLNGFGPNLGPTQEADAPASV